ncbi:MAG: hypothetical protein KDA69_12405 [Planctomycetaceae bacterium]|nr:hypothetical protein [Planctomycetaceae bacterium]
MSYTESLTVRILGDSSGLHQELSRVEQALNGLNERIESTNQAGAKISQVFQRVGNASRPLQQLGNLLNQVRQRAQALGQTPITLNVRPALAALQQLMSAITATANQLRALSFGGGGPSLPPAGPVGPAVPNTSRTTRGFASGGLVSGPPGIDRVPTRLTAGEFVLSRSAVETLGHGFVNRLNQRPDQLSTEFRSRPLPQASLALPPTQHASRHFQPHLQREPVTIQRTSQHNSETNHNTVNQIGGITVNVQQDVDLAGLLDSVQSQHVALRNRRG